MKVEDYVKLANISKVLVKNLNIMMDDLQHNQLIISLINKQYKVEARISFIHDLVLFPFDEIAETSWPGEDHMVQLLYESLFFLSFDGSGVPFHNSDLALPGDQEEAVNHFKF